MFWSRPILKAQNILLYRHEPAPKTWLLEHCEYEKMNIVVVLDHQCGIPSEILLRCPFGFPFSLMLPVVLRTDSLHLLFVIPASDSH